jgi:hypothetical protein
MTDDNTSIEKKSSEVTVYQKRLTHFISFSVAIFLMILGLCGILSPGFAGLHMSSLYSIIISLSGVVIFFFSYKNDAKNAFRACLFFGLFFALHSVAGFILGKEGVPSLGHSSQDQKLLVLIPGVQELGYVDHILNGFLGFALLGGAIDWWVRYSAEKKKF